MNYWPDCRTENQNNILILMFRFVIILIGFSALVTQVICVRELLISFSGNELTLGIYFSNWLVSAAAGSILVTRLKSSPRLLPYLQLGTALFFPVILIFIRLCRNYLGYVPGESPDLSLIFIISFILLGIPGFLSGAQFTAACSYLPFSNGKTTAANVYLGEAIGSIIGGILITSVMLTFLHNFYNALLLSLFNIFSCGLLLLRSRPWKRKILAITLFLLLVPLFLPVAEQLHQFTISAQWPGYKILEYKNSNYGNLALLQREEQLHLFNNGIPTAVAPVPDITQNETMAHIPLFMLNVPNNIMLIGNGISGLSSEILKHPIKSLDYAEPDPLIIDVTYRHLPQNILPQDPRLKIHYTDGRVFLNDTEKMFNLIFLNLSPPHSLEINRFYTSEFFSLCRQHLNPDGLLVLLLPSSESYLGDALRSVHKSVLLAAKLQFPSIRVIPGDNAIYLFSGNDSITSRSPAWLIEKADLSNIPMRTINQAYLSYKLNPAKENWFRTQINEAAVIDANSVFHPVAVFYSMLYWNAQYAPILNRVLGAVKNIPQVAFILLPLLILAMALFKKKQDRSGMGILFAIAASGFAGMACSVIFVLLFQSIYGYVYQWIGLITTTFMIGVSFGTYTILRREKSIHYRKYFLYAEKSWLMQFLLMLLFFTGVDSGLIPGYLSRAIILLLSSTAGILVGGQFALAVDLYKKKMHAERSAGIIYATDLLGGWLGGMSMAIIFIPIYGIWMAVYFLLSLKMSTILLLSFLNKFREMYSPSILSL